MKTKQLNINLIAVSLLIGTSVFAQTSEKVNFGGDSHGNGDPSHPNSNPLASVQPLKQENLDQKNLNEAFADFKRSIENLKLKMIPDYKGAGDDFWNGLSEKAIKIVKAKDGMIIKSIEDALGKIETFKTSVEYKAGIIRGYESEKQKYIEDNNRSTWKKTLVSLRSDLRDTVNHNFHDIIESMIPTDVVDYAGIFGYPQYLCDSKTCLKLLLELRLKTYDFIDEVAKTEIEVQALDEKKSIAEFYQDAYNSGYGRDMYYARKTANEEYRSALAELDLAQIKNNAAPTQ